MPTIRPGSIGSATPVGGSPGPETSVRRAPTSRPTAGPPSELRARPAPRTAENVAAPTHSPGNSETGAASRSNTPQMAPRATLEDLRERAGSAAGHKVLVGPGKRTDPLEQHQVIEAGYLTARSAMGRRIDNKGDLRRLVDGNESVHETRTRLKYGRGNLIPDIKTTSGISSQRADAGYTLAETEEKARPWSNRLAAAAYTLRAGNCDANGALVVRLHAPKLKGQESANTVSAEDLGHTWAEIKTPHRPMVTLDPWANGPAMQARDTAWADPDIRAETTTLVSIDARHGQAAHDALLDQAHSFARGPEKELCKATLKTTPRGSPDPNDKHLYGASNQLAESQQPDVPGFGDRARESLQFQKPLHQEILAVGAMRDGYQMNVAAAARQAQPVLQAAQTLDTMPDNVARPPIWKPQR